jgi:hypothetical protein
VGRRHHLSGGRACSNARSAHTRAPPSLGAALRLATGHA